MSASISSALAASLAQYDSEHGSDVSEESEDEACPDSADTAPSAQGKASAEADPGLADENKLAEGAEIAETDPVLADENKSAEGVEIAEADPGLGDEADAEGTQDEEGAK